MKNSTILYIDTTGHTLYLGVSQGDTMIAHKAVPSTSHRYHSAILIPTLRELFSECLIEPKALDAVVTNVGPGSFTGIRTGLTTVRTMGQWQDASIIPLTQFDIGALAAKQQHQSFPVAFYYDALRGRAYHAVMGWQDDRPCFLVEPQLVTPSEPPLDVLPIASTLMADGLQEYWDVLDLFQAESLSTLSQNMPQVVHQALINLGQPINENHPWVKPWENVLPLYVQRPNITVAKPKQPVISVPSL